MRDEARSCWSRQTVLEPEGYAVSAHDSHDAASAASHRRLVAVYPGSFDPATRGHIEIATRAAKIVDELVVAVYATPHKSLLFTIEERVDFWSDAIAQAGLANVRVSSYEGLTTDFARGIGARAIVRGLRAVSDFEVEFQQALMYRKLAPEIETLMIVTSLDHLFISSSLLKEVAKLHANLEDMVTARVGAALRAKYP
jgi:pantetheine-phosphate adenylyltransferase